MTSWVRALLTQLFVRFKYHHLRFGKIGKGCRYRELSSSFASSENIFLGNNVHIGPGAIFDGAGRIEIGDGCIFAPDIKIYSRTHNFDLDLQALPFDNIVLTASVRIGRYCWLGSNVIVLPGVMIGEGAVIGAGAVVSRDIPPYAIAVGNPAAAIRYRDQARFLELAKDDGNFVYTKFGHTKLMKPKVPRRKN